MVPPPATHLGRTPPAQPALLLAPRFLIAATIATAVVGVISAIPTAILDNPWFTRMTPVYTEQYIYWVATSVLAGALIATYFAGGGARRVGTGIGGGTLGYLAIGCPICNKVVVALLGSAGAMEYFAPVQPYLGAVGVLLVAAALAYRVRDLRRVACPRPAPG